MGSAQDYACINCGYEAKFVTEPFDFGMEGRVTTPVVCPVHAIKQADTRLKAYFPGWEYQRQDRYPCPRCRRKSPLWDGVTCPKCGERTLLPDPERGIIIWD